MKTRLFILSFALVAVHVVAQEEYTWGMITFEEPVPDYFEIGDSSENIWQIGKPDKSFFESAYSQGNAMVTDTINSYPPDNYSYFDIAIGEFNNDSGFFVWDFFIEMKHKFDTNFHKDGGYITISYDNKQTWVNIINDTSPLFQTSPGYDYFFGSNENDPYMEGLYTTSDTLFNGEYGFSGNSGDWMTTRFGWYTIPVKSQMEFDTLYVRFNFISDSASGGLDTGHEGWMIDDIRLYSIDMGDGVKDEKNLEFTILPNPVRESAVVRMQAYREIELDIYDIQGRMIRRKRYFDNTPIVLDRGQLKSGVYFVRILTDGNMSGVRRLVVE